jgi:hypothetical protein
MNKERKGKAPIIGTLSFLKQSGTDLASKRESDNMRYWGGDRIARRESTQTRHHICV